MTNCRNDRALARSLARLPIVINRRLETDLRKFPGTSFGRQPGDRVCRSSRAIEVGTARVEAPSSSSLLPSSEKTIKIFPNKRPDPSSGIPSVIPPVGRGQFSEVANESTTDRAAMNGKRENKRLESLGNISSADFARRSFRRIKRGSHQSR